jgi:hypothetical protein
MFWLVDHGGVICTVLMKEFRYFYNEDYTLDKRRMTNTQTSLDSIQRTMRNGVVARALAAGASPEQANQFADRILNGIAVKVPAFEELDSAELQSLAAKKINARIESEDVPHVAELREYFALWSPSLHMSGRAATGHVE